MANITSEGLEEEEFSIFTLFVNRECIVMADIRNVFLKTFVNPTYVLRKYEMNFIFVAHIRMLAARRDF